MLELITRFIVVGALAFGGGQAALPLVERLAVADTGWLTPSQFAAGVGLSYATPGLDKLFRLPRGSNDQSLLIAARGFVNELEPRKAEFIRHELAPYGHEAFCRPVQLQPPVIHIIRR